MTYRELRNKGVEMLEAADVPDADYDAGVLLCEASGLDQAALFMRLSAEAEEGLAVRYMEMVRDRAGRKPLQHILGTAWFMGLPFLVCRDVLCPRQDTEVLAEAALAEAESQRKPYMEQTAYMGQKAYMEQTAYMGQKAYMEQTGKKVLDLCTGSGCLAVSLAVLGRFDTVVATDLSEAALAVARKNAAANGSVIDFRQGDLFTPVGDDELFDIIVCNPPYIPSGELKDLMPEVRDHEPAVALDGGNDGLAFYRRLALGLWRHLAPGGAFFLECGAGQSGEVIGLLMEAGRYEGLHVTRDLAGHDRVVSGRLKP